MLALQRLIGLDPAVWETPEERRRRVREPAPVVEDTDPSRAAGAA